MHIFILFDISIINHQISNRASLKTLKILLKLYTKYSRVIFGVTPLKVSSCLALAIHTAQ